MSITVYRLPTKENKISVFSLQKTNRSCCFPYLYIPWNCNICIDIYIHIYIQIYINLFIYLFKYLYYIYLYISINLSISIYMLPFQMENKKRKPRRFSLICLPFAHRKMEVCRLSMCLRRNKWKLSVCKRTKWTNELGYLCLCLSLESW